LFEPTDIFGNQSLPKEKEAEKYTLLTQYQRDDYLYDVHQVLDPYELKIKVQVYQMNTYQLVASTICLEQDLRKELATD